MVSVILPVFNGARVLREALDSIFAQTYQDYIDEAGNIVTRQVLRAYEFRHSKRIVADCLAEDMFILPGTVFMRKSLSDQVGGFGERLSGYEDERVIPCLRWRYRLALYPAFLPRPLYRALRFIWHLARARPSNGRPPKAARPRPGR